MSRHQLVRAVAFDLDGLMFNTEEIYVDVARQMLNRRGHELDMDVIHQMMGRPAKTGLPIMIAHYDLTDDVAALEEETEQIFQGLLPQSLAPLPGLYELLQRLDEAAIPKAIATSSRRRYVEKILQLAQLPTRFEFLLTAEDVEHGKPHPVEIYLPRRRTVSVSPSAMMVLEDSEHGCQAACLAARSRSRFRELTIRKRHPEVDLRADSLRDERNFCTNPITQRTWICLTSSCESC